MRLDFADVLASAGMEALREARLDLDEIRMRLGRFPIVGKEPFLLTLSNEGGKGLRIQGETDVAVAIPCGRCLEDVRWVFHIRVDRRLAIGGSGAVEDAEGAGFVEGTSLDVDRLVFSEIVARWPMRVLCKEDCKGICKRCGANLNLGECQCRDAEPDPRMAAIRDVFQEFKEV